MCERIKSGYKLPRPRACPVAVYARAVLLCFHTDPTKRPGFAAVYAALTCADELAEFVDKTRSASADSVLLKHSNLLRLPGPPVTIKRTSVIDGAKVTDLEVAMLRRLSDDTQWDMIHAAKDRATLLDDASSPDTVADAVIVDGAAVTELEAQMLELLDEYSPEHRLTFLERAEERALHQEPAGQLMGFITDLDLETDCDSVFLENASNVSTPPASSDQEESRTATGSQHNLTPANEAPRAESSVRMLGGDWPYVPVPDGSATSSRLLYGAATSESSRESMARIQVRLQPGSQQHQRLYTSVEERVLSDGILDDDDDSESEGIVSWRTLAHAAQQQGRLFDLVVVLMERGSEYAAKIPGVLDEVSHNVIWVEFGSTMATKMIERLEDELLVYLLKLHGGPGPASSAAIKSSYASDIKSQMPPAVRTGIEQSGRAVNFGILPHAVTAAADSTAKVNDCISGETMWKLELLKGNRKSSSMAKTIDVAHLQAGEDLFASTNELLRQKWEPTMIGVSSEWSGATESETAELTNAVIQHACQAVCLSPGAVAKVAIYCVIRLLDEEAHESRPGVSSDQAKGTMHSVRLGSSTTDLPPLVNQLNDPGTWDFFISHTQRNGRAVALAEKLTNDLRKLGKTCWLDVNMADKSIDAMKEGVLNSKAMLAIVTGPCINDMHPEDDPISNAYFSREYCVQELRWAVAHGVPIIPIVQMEDKHKIADFQQLAPIDLKVLPPGLSYIDLNRTDLDYWRVGVNKVIQALPTANRPTPAQLAARINRQRPGLDATLDGSSWIPSLPPGISPERDPIVVHIDFQNADGQSVEVPASAVFEALTHTKRSYQTLDGASGSSGSDASSASDSDEDAANPPRWTFLVPVLSSATMPAVHSNDSSYVSHRIGEPPANVDTDMASGDLLRICGLPGSWLDAISPRVLKEYVNIAIEGAVQAGERDGSCIEALFRDTATSLLVRVRVPDIGFMNAVRAALFHPGLTDRLERHLIDWYQRHQHMDLAPPSVLSVFLDKAAFAKQYMAVLVQLDKLTLHQKDRVRDCFKHNDCPIIHIKGPAGAGKSFVAMHVVLEVIRRKHPTQKRILLVAPNPAMCLFFGHWLLSRTKKDPLVSEECRIDILHLGKGSALTDSVHKVQTLDFDYTHRTVAFADRRARPGNAADGSYELVIIDEAQHVFSGSTDERCREDLLKWVQDAKTHCLSGTPSTVICSDWAQSNTGLTDIDDTVASNHILRMVDDEVQLTEVVRSSSKIVAASHAFRFNKVADVEASAAFGPPLRPYLMPSISSTADKFSVYASKVIDALTDLYEEFGDVIGGCTAILVPDTGFREHLRTSLLAGKDEFALKHTGVSVQLVTAVGAHQAKRPAGTVVILDTVASFDGMERLVILAVGLDTPRIEEKDTILSCSMIYRAITRAHLFVAVIQEHVPGGWLEFLNFLQPLAPSPRKTSSSSRGTSPAAGALDSGGHGGSLDELALPVARTDSDVPIVSNAPPRGLLRSELDQSRPGRAESVAEIEDDEEAGVAPQMFDHSTAIKRFVRTRSHERRGSIVNPDSLKIDTNLWAANKTGRTSPSFTNIIVAKGFFNPYEDTRTAHDAGREPHEKHIEVGLTRVVSDQFRLLLDTHRAHVRGGSDMLSARLGGSTGMEFLSRMSTMSIDSDLGLVSRFPQRGSLVDRTVPDVASPAQMESSGRGRRFTQWEQGLTELGFNSIYADDEASNSRSHTLSSRSLSGPGSFASQALEEIAEDVVAARAGLAATLVPLHELAYGTIMKTTRAAMESTELDAETLDLGVRMEIISEQPGRGGTPSTWTFRSEQMRLLFAAKHVCANPNLVTGGELTQSFEQRLLRKSPRGSAAEHTVSTGGTRDLLVPQDIRFVWLLEICVGLLVQDAADSATAAEWEPLEDAIICIITRVVALCPMMTLFYKGAGELVEVEGVQPVLFGLFVSLISEIVNCECEPGEQGDAVRNRILENAMLAAGDLIQVQKLALNGHDRPAARLTVEDINAVSKVIPLMKKLNDERRKTLPGLLRLNHRRNSLAQVTLLTELGGSPLPSTTPIDAHSGALPARLLHSTPNSHAFYLPPAHPLLVLARCLRCRRRRQ